MQKNPVEVRLRKWASTFTGQITFDFGVPRTGAERVFWGLEDRP